MPPRKDITGGKAALAELERLRRMKSESQQRWRLRKRAGLVGLDVDATGASTDRPVGSTSAPPQTPPTVVPLLLKKQKELAARAVLRRFAGRGYADDGRFWALCQQRYPDLDLELEAMKLAEWLTEPRNEQRRCSKAFIANWLAKAAARPPAPPAPVVATNGSIGNRVYHQPITQQGRNPGPPDLPLFEAPVSRIDPAEMARFVAGRRDVPLAEKLKARAGRQG